MTSIWTINDDVNLDDLDDLEESRVDDNVSWGFFDEYFTD